MAPSSSIKGRNLWPVAIMVTFGLFIAGTAGLVVLSARNNLELVQPDYYEQELRFQEHINQREHARALPQSASLTYDSLQHRLIVALPLIHATAQTTGEIQLYRPSAASKDRRVPLQLDAQGRQFLDATALEEGLWRIRVTWRVGGEDFAYDQKVVIGSAQPR